MTQRPNLATLAEAARDMRKKADAAAGRIASLQDTLAAVFARAGNREVVLVLNDLFAAATIEGRAWGEYIWLLACLKTLRCDVPQEDLDRAGQALVNMLSELAK